MPKFIVLWTDMFVFALVLALLVYVVYAARSVALRSAWRSVGRSAPAMSAAVLLIFFGLVGVLDSVHYRPVMPPAEHTPADAPAQYSPVMRSALDDLLALTQLSQREKTYSQPLALRQFTKETQVIQGVPVRDYPRLQFAGQGVDEGAAHRTDVFERLVLGLGWGALASLVVGLCLTLMLRRRCGGFVQAACYWFRGQSSTPWRAMWFTFSAVVLALAVVLSLSTNYHVLGTDRTGNDVLWQCLKSVRTALVIGTLTTLAMLPPALFFGIAAGYFKGWVDDLIQYLYTTLTSIPGVLLIAACVLMMQVYIDNNPELFDTVASRADLRLFLLCLILGLTGWAGLCRLLRAETLKLRELEYVQAARAFGVGPWRIMRRHILPNLMHIVLITLVLEFSGLVLYEAVLSYLGIGVDPSTPSFGTMIDAARLEMSRDPMIWWNLLGAFFFLLVLVLSANIFADAVQQAFDPRSRLFKPSRLPGGRKRAVPATPEVKVH